MKGLALIGTYFILMIGFGGMEILQAQNVPESCQGVKGLCDLRYDQVLFPATHNSYNYSRGPKRFTYPNQQFPIPRQLEDGVRAFMIDLHYLKKEKVEGEVWVFHQYQILGKERFSEILEYFRGFLESYPNEIITLILESYVEPEDAIEVFRECGLDKYAWSQEADTAWPRLSEMINLNKRLVVLSDKCCGDAPWYMNVWDHATETPWANKSKKNYKNELGRGEAQNSLFILNHFLTGTVARRSKNKRTNAFDDLRERVMKCESDLGRRPNFLVVDWYAKGDLVKLVKKVNENRLVAN